MDPDELMTFLEFVEERHLVWERRQTGYPQPWTENRILRERKFTNVFRVLDYGSQFLLKELLEPDLSSRDTLMRCFLYRHTNLPSAWEAFKYVEGYPHWQELDLLRDFWKGYRDNGNRVFSGAYMIYPQSATPGTDKIDSIIDLTKRLFTPRSPDDIAVEFTTEAVTQQERFRVLRKNKGVADFMSMQILTDWGYSSQCGEDRENEFVVPGPGARKGAAVLDSSRKAEELIPELQKMIWDSEGCPSLQGRKPSLMDVQNCLCEFSKYHRYESRPSPQHPFVPTHDTVRLEPELPLHWNR
jgi:hypothetical protein